MLKFEEDKNYLDGYGQKVVVNGVAVGEFVSYDEFDHSYIDKSGQTLSFDCSEDGAKRKLRQLFKKLNS